MEVLNSRLDQLIFVLQKSAAPTTKQKETTGFTCLKDNASNSRQNEEEENISKDGSFHKTPTIPATNRHCSE